ncbi:keratin-associated protein 13-2-like [Apodemus sylvaticus]|uniref:keratin-associated protein 13-2-like n=1 Tax=Apodemus sylvaticus TaxID=10129 RepID=UPI002242EDD0|nr:keratin-associated protein 13-2-like [Apodemus sylvaticus]
MSYSCCSGSFSSRSYGSQLCYPSSRGSSFPSQLTHRTKFCSPRNFHLGSSFSHGCHQNCFQPIRCQTSHVVHSSCQRPFYRPSVSSFCSPCRTTYSGSLGFGSSSCHSLGYGSKSIYTSGCGSRGFRPVSYGVRGSPSFGYGSGFCHPTYVTYRNFQSSCHRPTCGSTIWRSSC